MQLHKILLLFSFALLRFVTSSPRPGNGRVNLMGGRRFRTQAAPERSEYSEVVAVSSGSNLKAQNTYTGVSKNAFHGQKQKNQRKNEYNEVVVNESYQQTPKFKPPRQQSRQEGEYQQVLVGGALQPQPKFKPPRQQRRQKGEYQQVLVGGALQEQLKLNAQRQPNREEGPYNQVVVNGKLETANSGRRQSNNRLSQSQSIEEQPVEDTQYDTLDFSRPQHGVDILKENRRRALNAQKGRETFQTTKLNMRRGASRDSITSSGLGFVEPEEDGSIASSIRLGSSLSRSGSAFSFSSFDSQYASIERRPFSRSGSSSSNYDSGAEHIYEEIPEQVGEPIYEEIPADHVPKNLPPPPLPPRNRVIESTPPKRSRKGFFTRKQAQQRT